MNTLEKNLNALKNVMLKTQLSSITHTRLKPVF